jgi:hypothetical protein
MAESMKVHLKMARKMVRELSNGQMETNTLVAGKTANKMELVFNMKGKMVLKNKENGPMVSDKDGLQLMKCSHNQQQPLPKNKADELNLFYFSYINNYS